MATSTLRTPTIYLKLLSFSVILSITACEDKTEPSHLGRSTASASRQSSGQGTRSEEVSLVRNNYLASGALHSDQRSALRRELSRLSDDDLSDLLKMLERESGVARDYGCHDIIIEIAQRNPAAALKWFVDTGEFDLGFVEVSRTVGSASPEMLRDWYSTKCTTLSPQDRSFVTHAVFSALATRDPLLAETALANVREAASRNIALQAVFSTLAASDPVSAERLALSKFNGLDADMALSCIADALAGKPEDALRIVGRIGSKNLRGSTSANIVRQWIAVDPVSATEYLNGIEREALQAILGVNPGYADSIVARLCESDPTSASSLLGKLVLSSATYDVFTAMVSRIARTSPDEALSLVLDLPASNKKAELLADYYKIVGNSQWERAVSSVSTLEGAANKNVALGALAALAAQDGLSRLKEVSSAMSPSDARVFLAGGLKALSGLAPSAVATHMSEPGSEANLDFQQREAIYSALGAGMQTNEPVVVKQWLDTLNPESRKWAMRGVAGEMVRTDVAGLANMLSSLPRDDAWVEAARVLVAELKNTDPEVASKWISAIDSVQSSR